MTGMQFQREPWQPAHEAQEGLEGGQLDVMAQTL